MAEDDGRADGTRPRAAGVPARDRIVGGTWTVPCAVGPRVINPVRTPISGMVSALGMAPGGGPAVRRRHDRRGGRGERGHLAGGARPGRSSVPGQQQAARPRRSPRPARRRRPPPTSAPARSCRRRRVRRGPAPRRLRRRPRPPPTARTDPPAMTSSHGSGEPGPCGAVPPNPVGRRPRAAGCCRPRPRGWRSPGPWPRRAPPACGCCPRSA